MAGFCHWRHELMMLAAIILEQLTNKKGVRTVRKGK